MEPSSSAKVNYFYELCKNWVYFSLQGLDLDNGNRIINWKDKEEFWLSHFVSTDIE
jgi:hypothetical protein